eukprot:CAMPEP_0167754294 /NCGR_PEP_ID=MMETSP0110_2-20121227/8189_1 /TAXON_ID=629695 /ORGANISM="Gymnochlora sp., Strain CCMP2014" /LENGTH=1479 /DNA_ID=CAMNT_0007640155 /DNA_START=868 /DNA_END=5307 /DNA_ORIENTATION=-
MGVIESCMPDEKLLDGVIQVELHNNKVSQYRGGDEINHLTDKLQSRLLRGLKKIVPDTSEPLGPATIDEKVFQKKYEREVEQVFLRFFVKLFRNYKRYVEAPSEEVVEKYKKEEFLSEHGDRCEWLKEVMETQMFQCFVDERYEYSNKTDNFEVLFFDECISKHEGKQSAFLSDTSQDHRPDRVEVSMAPNVSGLDKKQWRYLEFPSLDPNLMLPIRKPKKLETEAEEARDDDRRIDMSRMAMKFFKEKRLYSQHFHSLSLHSRKQNIFFNHLVKYLKSAQAQEETFAKQQLQLYKNTLGRYKFYPTATSIDDVYAALVNHIRGISEREILSVRDVGNQCCQDLYTTAYQKENSIDLLLAEASILEKKTGRGKNRLEDAKKLAAQNRSKFSKLQNSLIKQGGSGDRGLLTQGQLLKVVAAQGDMDNSFLGKVEAATHFRTVLNAYRGRMPRIVNTIRNDNIERIDQFKKSMTAYVTIKREALERELATLKKMEEAAKAIDTKRDMELFTQGTSDFWASEAPSSSTENSKPKLESKTKMRNEIKNSQASLHVSTSHTEDVKMENMKDQDSAQYISKPQIVINSTSTSQPPSRNSPSTVSPTGPPIPETTAPPPIPDSLTSPSERVRSTSGQPPPLPRESKGRIRSLSARPSGMPPQLPRRSNSGDPSAGPPALPRKIGGPAPTPPTKRPPPLRTKRSRTQSHSPPSRPPPLPKVPGQPGRSPPPPPNKGYRGASPPAKRAPLHPKRESRMSFSASKPALPAKVHSRNTSRIAIDPTAIVQRRLSGTRDFAVSSPRARSPRGGKSAPVIPCLDTSIRSSRVSSAARSPAKIREIGIRSLVASPKTTKKFDPNTNNVIRATDSMNLVQEGVMSYTIDMWGYRGFDFALAQSQHSKSVIKKLTQMLEEWHQIAVQVGRKAETAWKGMPSVVNQERTMNRLWSSLRGTAHSKLIEYLPQEDNSGLGLSAKLTALAQGLRVSKGMVKKSMFRYQDLRTKLTKEVEEAEQRRDSAAHELKLAESKFALALQEQQKIEKSDGPSQVTLDRVWAKVDQAKKVKLKRAHHLMSCENELTAIVRKHDFVFARMQALFEMKERECQCKLKHSAKFLILSLDDALSQLLSSTIQFLNASKELDFKGDLTEFLRSRNATPGRLDLQTDGLSPKLSTVLGLRGFDKAIQHANRNIAVIKTMESALEASAEVQEGEIKSMRKWMSQFAKRSSTGPIFSLHNGHTLVPAFNSIARGVEKLLQYWVALQEQYVRFERGLHSLRTELKAKVKFQQKQHESELRSFDQARAECERAERELKKARSEQDAAIDKHHSAQKAADRGESKRTGLFRWGTDDLHKLKSRMDQKIKEYNKAVDTLKRKRDALDRAKSLLEVRTGKQLDQMQATDMKRYETVKTLATNFAEERVKRLQYVISVLREAQKTADNVQIDENIQRFLKKNKTGLGVPPYVTEDYKRSFGYYYHVETATPSDGRRLIWL